MLLPFLVLSGSLLAADDARKEWHYETPNGIRRVVDQGNGTWLLHFPNGSTTRFEEIARTDEYVQIRNLKNNNVQRLFAVRGMSQKEGKGQFRKFADGKWVTPTAADSDYRIRLVYFVPADREPIPEYQRRIQSVMTLVAEIFTRDLQSKGYETEGPRFETRDGRMVVHLVRGGRTAREYNGLPVEKAPQHPKLVSEAVEQQLGSTRDNAYVIFAETWENGPSRKMWPGHVAVAVASPPRGGRVVCSAWMLQDAFCPADPVRLRHLFFDETPVPGRTAYDHKGPNSPVSEIMEDGVGSVLHELGHLFGPTHHRSRPTNIMGGGFRDIRWNVGLKRNSRLQAGFSKEHGWLLMTSRFLNPKVDRSDNARPTASVALAVQGRFLSVTIDAQDDRELAYVSVVEDEPGKGRLLLDARQLSGTAQTVTFRFGREAFKDPGPNTDLQVIVIDGGGNFRKITRKLSDAANP